MANKVWIQLYLGDNGEIKSGNVFTIEAKQDTNIHGLKKAVKKERPNDLAHWDAADLYVFNAGTEYPPKDEDKLCPGKLVPTDTTADLALLVVAPLNNYVAGQLLRGTYYSAIQTGWKPVEAKFTEADWNSIRRTEAQVEKIVEYAPVIAGMNISGRPALDASTSSGNAQDVDIVGRKIAVAEWAHLIPHSPTCSSAYGPVAELALGQNLGSEKERKKTRNRQILVAGVLKRKSFGRGRVRADNTGLKHNSLNKVKLVCQMQLMDMLPCILIVPLLTLEDTKAWSSGAGYSALLCVGDFDDATAALHYSYVTGTGLLPFCNNLELQRATDLLACFTKALAYSLVQGECFVGWESKEGEKEKLERVQASLKQSKKVHIPVLSQEGVRVAKVTFDAENSQFPNPPDPFLLAVRAAVTWSWRNNQKLLPVCPFPEEEECSDCARMEEYAEQCRKEICPCNQIEFVRGLEMDDDELTV